MPNTALNRTTQTLMTNKSGGSVAYGGVVIVDTTTDSSFTTTTTSGISTAQVGVVLEPNGIANNALGMVAVGGWCPKITLNTAATRGQFIKTHTVAGQGTPHSSPQVEGDFAVALEASATPACNLFGSPNGPLAGGAGTVTNTGTLTANKLVVGNGSSDITVVTATNGQVPIGKTSDGSVTLGAITGSAGVAVTNGAASIALTGTGIALITETVTSASQASVSFTSIPATYRDLIVKVRGRGDTAAVAVNVLVRLNNDSGSNYHNEYVIATGTISPVTATQVVSQTSMFMGALPAATATASYSGMTQILVGDYRGTTFFKTLVATAGASLGTGGATQAVDLIMGQWISATAVTRLDVLLSAGNFVDNTVVSLYGSF